MLNWWKHYDIMKTVDGAETLYLRRYFIFRSKLFNIFLHYIPQPDTDPDPHNHPWNFFGVVLRGGYYEKLYSPINLVEGQQSLLTDFGKSYLQIVLESPEFLDRGMFSAAYRPSERYHQITYVKPNTWTLIFTGPVKNEWKFLTKDGPVMWRKYLNLWTDVDMD